MSRYTELVAWRDSNGIAFPEQLADDVIECLDLEDEQAEEAGAQVSAIKERLDD